MNSLMGLHFNPESDAYPRAHAFWELFQYSYQNGDDRIKFLIEALYHAIGDVEHEGDSGEVEQVYWFAYATAQGAVDAMERKS